MSADEAGEIPALVLDCRGLAVCVNLLLPLTPQDVPPCTVAKPLETFGRLGVGDRRQGPGKGDAGGLQIVFTDIESAGDDVQQITSGVIGELENG